eukprot:1041221_1
MPRESSNLISDPLRVIDDFVQTAPVDSLKSHNTDWGVRERFEKALAGHWDQIPLLNSVSSPEMLRTNSLVRFRGMVQETMNPEYYLGLYEEVDCKTDERFLRAGKYRDTIHHTPGRRVDMHAPVSVTFGRQPLLCARVPGASEWVHEGESGGASKNGGGNVAVSSSSKRQRESSPVEGDSGRISEPEALSGLPSVPGNSESDPKRSRTSDMEVDQSGGPVVMEKGAEYVGKGACLVKQLSKFFVSHRFGTTDIFSVGYYTNIGTLRSFVIG